MEGNICCSLIGWSLRTAAWQGCSCITELPPGMGQASSFPVVPISLDPDRMCRQQDYMTALWKARLSLNLELQAV